MTLVALGLPALAAVLVVRAVWPPPLERPLAFRRFQAFVAAAGGLAASSCAFFLWYPFLGHPKTVYPAVEMGVCVLLILAATFRLMRPSPSPVVAAPPEPRSWARWLWVPFAGSAVVAGRYLAVYCTQEPHGLWDAISIWNLRARYLFRAGANWPDTFSPINLHTDYPLFVPATIARAWCYDGVESTAAPIAVLVLMVVLAAGALVAGLNYLRGCGQGWLAGAVLLAALPFVQTAGYQYADVPLSVFVLAAVAVLVAHDRAGGKSRVPAALAGALASFAAWTKNEGLLVFVVLLACRAVVLGRRSRRELLRELPWFLAGAVPAALALVTLKLGFASPNDIIAGQGARTVDRLATGSRYAMIGSAVGGQLWKFGPFLLIALVAYGVLMGRPPEERRVRGASLAWAVVALTAVGFGLVYLTTPHDLKWHLSTSLTRLFVQLWPLFLFALFLTTDTADGGSDTSATHR